MRTRQVVIAVTFPFLAAGALRAATFPVMGPELKVSVSVEDVQSNPKTAVFPDGGFVVAWNAQGHQDSGHTAVVVHARFFTAGGAASTGEILLGVSGTSPTLDGVSPLGNDRFVVAWDDYGTPATRVMIQIFNRSGKAVTGPLQVHANSPENRYFGTVTTNAGGEIAVLWAADVGNDLTPDYRNDAYARFFDKSLTPLTGEMLVRAGSFTDQSGPFPDSAALAPDGSLAASLTYAGDGVSVFVARLAPDGTSLPVADLYPPDTCCILNTYDSSLAMAADGTFFVAFDSVLPASSTDVPPPLPASPISGRFFDAGGTAPDGQLMQVNRRSYGQLVLPVAAALPGGGFVTAWQDEAGRDGSGFGIFGRLLATDGTPLWRDFQIDATSAGNQFQPSVASGPGGAVVVWLSGSATTVYARRVSAAATQ